MLTSFPLLLLSISLFLTPLPLTAQNWSGKVVGISDGDTFTIMRHGKAVKVRLYGIDCPESHQDYGMKAKKFASSLAYGREVGVIYKDKDRYGRIIGDIILPDGRSVNQELVREGFAWWYRQYAPPRYNLRVFRDTGPAGGERPLGIALPYPALGLPKGKKEAG